ncbi:splicing factor, partial [Ascosphaera pollenicola]
MGDLVSSGADALNASRRVPHLDAAANGSSSSSSSSDDDAGSSSTSPTASVSATAPVTATAIAVPAPPSAAPQSVSTIPVSDSGSDVKKSPEEDVHLDKEKPAFIKQKPYRNSKYRHVAAYHTQPRDSCLSRETDESPSFIGFRNLMVLVLVCMNLRLVIENFMKYGVLICIRCHDYRKQDIQLGLLLFALVPCHLFVAYLIELVAAQQVKGAIGRRKKDESVSKGHDEQLAFKVTWICVAIAHTINA